MTEEPAVTRVSKTQKRELRMLAQARSTPDNTVTISAVLRDAVTEYLENHADELPPTRGGDEDRPRGMTDTPTTDPINTSND